ncbi:alkaline phosphatase [Bryobacterales bacterium F-183]|nr:alkaline phosphatase [Bryobacterales bacterium F-183]
MEAVFVWITTYGYIALFCLLMLGIVGLPIPDETLMVFCGYLISEGRLDPMATWLTAFAGSATGITISYILGRKWGLTVVHRFGKYMHLTPERWDKVMRWFDKIGHWTLFIGYYIAGVRHFTAVVAGASGCKTPTFALYSYTGGALWVTIFLSLGYVVGANWKVMAEKVHHNLAIVSGVLFALIAIYFLVRWFRNRPLAKESD